MANIFVVLFLLIQASYAQNIFEKSGTTDSKPCSKDVDSMFFKLRDEFEMIKKDVSDMIKKDVSDMKDALKALSERTLGLKKEGKCNKTERPIDCEDVYNHGNRNNGVYMIYPDGETRFDVYCDMKTDGGGWTVIQRRYNGKTDFYRTWMEYKHGFGDKNKEYWLGNDKIHLLTKMHSYRLRVDLEDFKGVSKYAFYSKFYVGKKTTDYVLSVGGYNGTAGDKLTEHNGNKFSTKDHDNDSTKGDCAKLYKGGWWYHHCYGSNLNGLYLKNTIDHKAMVWFSFHNKPLSLKSSEMKIRRKQ